MVDPIGIATWNYHEGSLAERIDRFSRIGFNAVSLSAGDARALCRGATPDVEDAILRRGLALTIHAAFAPAKQPISDSVLMEDFQSYLSWHARTGALYTVNYDAACYPSASTDEPEYDSETMHRVLKRMLSACNGSGFSVGVEDWPRNKSQLEAVADLRAYPHFGILIDLGHLNLRIRKNTESQQEFPLNEARRHLDAIDLPVNELHVHNNDGVNDHHAPPTTGNADLTALACILRRKGVRCVSTIEIAPGWCGLTEKQGLDAAVQALEFWKEVYASPSAAVVRQ